MANNADSRNAGRCVGGLVNDSLDGGSGTQDANPLDSGAFNPVGSGGGDDSIMA